MENVMAIVLTDRARVISTSRPITSNRNHFRRVSARRTPDAQDRISLQGAYTPSAIAAPVAGLTPTDRRAGTDRSIAAGIDGRTAALAPSTDLATATPVTTAGPVSTRVDAATTNRNRALQKFTSEVTLAVTVGSLAGTILGAGVGCVMGGAVPAFTTVGLPVGVGTGIGGALIGAPIGALAGTILVGGPVLIASGIRFVNDLNTSPTPAPAG